MIGTIQAMLSQLTNVVSQEKVQSAFIVVAMAVSALDVIRDLTGGNRGLIVLSALPCIVCAKAFIDVGLLQELTGYRTSFKKELSKEKDEGVKIKALEGELEAAKTNLATLEKTLETTKGQCTELGTALQAQQTEVQSLMQAKTASHALIQSLEEKIIELTAQKEALAASEASLNSSFTELTELYTRTLAELNDSQLALIEKETTIRSLTDRVTLLETRLPKKK